MKKTAELPVAESVKLCIELDKEMEEKWKNATKRLEGVFKFLFRKHICITDDLLFQCLLYCFEKGEEFPFFFADSYSQEEIQSMSQ
jgi:hypothetical protein